MPKRQKKNPSASGEDPPVLSPAGSEPPSEGRAEEDEGIDTSVTPTLLNQLLYVLGIEDLRRERWRLIKLNFMLGLARGLGFFLGATIIGAIVFWLILQLVDAPLIGGFISQILDIVKGTAK